MSTFVLSFNIDTRSPYIYDLSSDHQYRPYVPNQNVPEPIYIDYASFPRFQLGKEDDLCKKWNIPQSSHGFCLLDDFYFFRTILQSESQKPTVVLPEEYMYRASFTFEQFLKRFSQTYKIIYHRWRALELWTPDCDIPVSMYTMFQTKPGDLLCLSFREWMKRVCL